MPRSRRRFSSTVQSSTFAAKDPIIRQLNVNSCSANRWCSVRASSSARRFFMVSPVWCSSLICSMIYGSAKVSALLVRELTSALMLLSFSAVFPFRISSSASYPSRLPLIAFFVWARKSAKNSRLSASFLISEMIFVSRVLPLAFFILQRELWLRSLLEHI